jgi:hypothetical protein
VSLPDFAAARALNPHHPTPLPFAGWPDNAKKHFRNHHPLFLTYECCVDMQLDPVTKLALQPGQPLGAVGAAGLAVPIDVDDDLVPTQRGGAAHSIFANHKKVLSYETVAKHLVVGSAVTFRQALSPSFRTAFDATADFFGGAMTYCSQPTLAKAADLFCTELVKKQADMVIKEVVNEKDAKMSVTYDGGQASNKKGFFGCTGHYCYLTPGERIKMRHLVLGAKRWKGKHTRDSTQSMLDSVLTANGCTFAHLQAAVHDGATNMELEAVPNVIDVDCLAHASQLCVTDLTKRASPKSTVLTDFESLRGPVHELAGAFRASPLRRELLYAAQKSLALPERTVILAPDHRWNTDFYEHERLFQLAPAIRAIPLQEWASDAPTRTAFVVMKESFDKVEAEVRSSLMAYRWLWCSSIIPLPPGIAPSSIRPGKCFLCSALCASSACSSPKAARCLSLAAWRAR